MSLPAIDTFWKAFLHHKDLFADPHAEKEDQMMLVLDALRLIDPRLYYHIGHHDAGIDLLLSAEGHYDLADPIIECLNRAPECEGWRFRPILDSDILEGKRNEALFPADENGDVLFNLARQTFDLLTERPVDFCHIFSSKKAARAFASALDGDDAVAIEPYKNLFLRFLAKLGIGKFTWQVIVTRPMAPSHRNITAHETQLASLAAPHQGQPDGWGFMSQ